MKLEPATHGLAIAVALMRPGAAPLVLLDGTVLTVAGALGCDVVFTMVGSPDDVEAVTIGEEGALGGMKPDSVLVE